MPVGPAFAGGRLSVSLAVTDRGLWRRTGMASDGAADLLTGHAASKVYPLIAEAAADAGVAPAGFRRIQLAVVACGGFVVGAILLLGWARRRPKERRTIAQAPRPVSHATPLYRPVVEIGTGDIVGVDVVAGGEVSSNRALGASAVEQALAEMAPVLHAHPELMLSLTPVSTRAAVEEIAGALSRSMSKHGIDAKQIVFTALPNVAAPEAMEAIRAAGVRLALGGLLSSEGGLMALATQQPDFIAFGAEVLGGERELAILHAAAGVARKFGIGVVVRGVEAPEHVEWLRAVGVTTASGPAFGHALNARSIAELVATAARAKPEARVA
jgi:EAL domain-containing protein (putative c-di-GMP-specific phosphodiesterase class I)